MKVPVIVLSLCLSACGSILHGSDDQDPQKIIDKRLLGTSVGDFIQRYGAPQSRSETGDGMLSLVWDAPLPAVPAGLLDPEQRICELRIVADRDRRITSAAIVHDGEGLRRVSRCAELFAAP